MAQDVTIAGASYEDVPGIEVPKTGGGTSSFYDVSDTTATAADVASGKSFYLASGLRATGAASYAGAPANNGNANRANAILYGTVDSTSTATTFTATVEGLTELTDGTTVMLHNGVVTSASGFTVNVNGLGAKKCYNNMTNATQDTTIFNVSYTMLFVYSTALDSGNGGWWIYRGYDGNTNTIGYQLRSNSGNLVASDTGYRYRLWLTSADGSKWVPINTSTSTNATSKRTLNTRPIDPFGPIVYRATNGTCTAGTGIGATAIWQQYTLTIGYSYMASGFSLTAQDSVYLRCTPQTDGSAVMQDIVQTLPTSKDGKIYIHLGTAYSTTNMELTIEHPVYWHDGTGIRLWTGAESGGGPEPSSTTPAMDGTAAVGTATTYARADHVHPTDTSRVAASVTNANGLTGTIANTGSVKLESVTAAGKTSTVLASSIGSRLASTDESSENYAIVEARTTYAKMEAEGASGTSSVTVEPSGVSIDKLVTPTTNTMPTTKQYVDDGLAAKQATLVSGTNIKTINGESLLGSGDLTISGGGSTAGGVTVRGARVTVPKRTSTAQSHTVVVNGLGEIDAHDIVLFFGTGGYDVIPAGYSYGSYRVHAKGTTQSAFDAFAAIVSPNYEVGSQASIVGSNASLCNTTTPLVGDTVTITATSSATFTVYDAASGGIYAESGTVTAGGTYSFTVECATSYIDAIASGGGIRD